MNAVPQAIGLIEDGLKAQQIGVDAFCKRMGIHRATWQRWKARKTSPTLRESHKMIEIAKGFGIELTAAHFIEAA